MNPKILMVYYSRSGNTRALAGKIIEKTGCDWVEIKPETSFHAPFSGYLKALGHSMMKRTPKLRETAKGVSGYDLVIIGGPIWAGRVASPVRTFLRENRDQFKNVAFFVTQGGRHGGENVLRQMERDAGMPPLASLVMCERDLQGRLLKHAILGFTTRLKEALPAPAVQASRESTPRTSEVRT
jgi:flavodoxin